jgi:hypothetical protein
MNLSGLLGTSGMIKLPGAKNDFLVVDDTKGAGARLEAICIEEDGPKVSRGRNFQLAGKRETFKRPRTHLRNNPNVFRVPDRGERTLSRLFR